MARHDDHEATYSVWVSPRVALAQYWQGQMELAPPQIMRLAQLARHTTLASVLQAARTTPPPVVAPESFDDNGQRVICYPGDDRHSLRTRALLAPTRLIFRNKRFESMSGFDGLFD
jgi:hypothetical protein